MLRFQERVANTGFPEPTASSPWPYLHANLSPRALLDLLYAGSALTKAANREIGSCFRNGITMKFNPSAVTSEHVIVLVSAAYFLYP